MLGEIDLNIISFIVNLSFFIAAVMVAWVSVRNYYKIRKLYNISFGLGLLLLAAANLLKNIFNANILTGYIPFLLIAFILMVEYSYIRKRWHYLLLAFGLIAFIIPQNGYWPLLYPILLSPIVYLSYRYGCQNICDESVCKNDIRKQKEKKIWAVIFALSITLPVISIFEGNTSIIGQVNISIIGILLTVTLSALLYYHIFKCVMFSKAEKAILPMVTSFVVVIIALNYFNGNLVSGFLKKNMQEFEEEEIKLVQIYTDQRYPGDTLANKIIQKDANLNDLADEIYAKTGIKITFFYGTERMAGAVSDSGTRMIGTKIDSPVLDEKVLKNGEEYSLDVEKGGKLYLGTYTPVYKGKEIIGMIGIGKPLGSIYNLIDKIIYRTIVGLSLVMIAVYGIIFYIIPVNRKKKTKA